jgi:hypothetical protein
MLAYCEEDRGGLLAAFGKRVTRRSAMFGFGGRNRGGLMRGAPGVDWKTDGEVTGKWVHLAWVYDGGPRTNVRLYRDGKLNAQRDFMTMDTIGDYPMYLGGIMNPRAGAESMFKGGIASVRAYDYARTPGEIAAAAGR